MWTLFVCLVLINQARSQIDDDILANIFGTPEVTVPTPSGQAVTRANLEDITVKPTDGTTVFTDKNGEQCKCVPYYLCDADLNAIHMNNESITGWGRLDVRFGEDECQESIERCCKAPLDPGAVPTPTPGPIMGCGYRKPGGLDFELIGGSGAEAGFGEFPWVVAMLDSSDDDYKGVGVLIHPSVVMTGAHIANKPLKGFLKIRAGEWDTQTLKERLPHQEKTAEDIILHEGYNPKNLKNDIALVKLESPVDITSHINVLCLPDQGESFDNYKQCVANGWGTKVFGLKDRYAVIMKRVELDMVRHDDCNRRFKKTRLGPRFNLHESFVCAGGEPGRDTCSGDGGAPLACPIGENRYKLAGLVAWGIGCNDDVPAAYVNVAMFRNWVDDKMAVWGYQVDRLN